MLLPHQFLLPGNPIARILADENPDLVEVCDKYNLHYLSGLLRRRRVPGYSGRPVTIGLTCERMDENMAAYFTSNALGNAFCRWYMKWIYFPLFDHHIANSRHTADELFTASRGHMVRRGVWTLPMGVDADQFSPSRRSPQIRQRLLDQTGGNHQTRLLLYAGRLAPEKNLPLLVATIERLTAGHTGDYHLLIAGLGVLREPLERECRQRAPGRVHFLGHISDPSQLGDLYANADVFLHPNPREPFGIAPLEAMASGLALVAPHSGGVTSYANATNAWLTDAEPAAFAEAVRDVFRDPELALDRLKTARLTAEQHRWENVSLQFLQLYQELHARFQGEEIQGLAPSFYSSEGNWIGVPITASRKPTDG
jgi:alpha-1,6-mannosyltransferase